MGYQLTCEECGREPVMTKDGICFECSKIAEREDPFPDREIEFANLSEQPGQTLPRVRVVSQVSHSWTSEARRAE